MSTRGSSLQAVAGAAVKVIRSVDAVIAPATQCSRARDRVLVLATDALVGPLKMSSSTRRVDSTTSRSPTRDADDSWDISLPPIGPSTGNAGRFQSDVF